MSTRALLCSLAWSLWASQVVCAEIVLPPLFSDHAVLQRCENVPIWGKAEPGERVSVRIGNIAAETKAGADGRWGVTLDLSATDEGPHFVDIVGRNRIRLSDVLVGEVWVCGGQSNMEWTLAKSAEARTELAEAGGLPRVRHFRVHKKSSPQPLSSGELAGRWVPAGLETAKDFTAIGWMFGKEIHQKLDGTPVGLINVSWGGSPVEAWTSEATLAMAEPSIRGFVRNTLEQARGPRPPLEFGTPTWLYNGMIAPLIPYAMRGVVWYQGESNAWRWQQYGDGFPLVIQDWRARWGRGDFPFYFCQLPNFGPYRESPSDEVWSVLREAQTAALSLSETGMAVLIDAGEAKDVHPKSKRAAAHRLAALALARTYGQRDQVDTGPVFAGMETDAASGRMRVRFTGVADGLIAKQLPAMVRLKYDDAKEVPLVRNSPGGDVEGFALCDAAMRWRWANARVDGSDSVVVWHDEVPAPVAVRYAWASNPVCNLYNTAGFPAGPFRTDAFPVDPIK